MWMCSYTSIGGFIAAVLKVCRGKLFSTVLFRLHSIENVQGHSEGAAQTCCSTVWRCGLNALDEHAFVS